ncbi:Bug family tripartite tricarboxylate transporter substrate binding protein [Devosia sp. A449]
MKSFLAAVSVGLLAAIPLAASAQEFPQKEVSLAIAFSAGGSTDVLARYVADGLGKSWGQTVVPQNLPGAGTAIAAAHVAEAEPDGYTILFVSSSYTTNAALQPNLPFDPKADLIPVASVSLGQSAVTVGSGVQATTITEFVEEAKGRGMFYATAGLGSSSHFSAELFNAATDSNIEPVHYKGAAESIPDLVSGRVDAWFGSVAQVLPAVHAGQLRVLAVSNEMRAPALPDVPTLIEAGIEGADPRGVRMLLFVPAETPIAIQERINASVNELMRTPEAIEFLASQSFLADPKSVAEVTTLVSEEIDRWRDIAETRGIVAE